MNDICKLTEFGLKLLEQSQTDEIQQKSSLQKRTMNEVKILLIKCIEGIAVHKNLIKEVAQYGIAQKL
jgi:hypothetical protein